jgi:hypothetical protein
MKAGNGRPQMDRKIIDAHVIRWEISDVKWGVAVRYDDQTRDTWQVGDRKAAEGEVARLRGLKTSL